MAQAHEAQNREIEMTLSAENRKLFCHERTLKDYPSSTAINRAARMINDSSFCYAQLWALAVIWRCEMTNQPTCHTDVRTRNCGEDNHFFQPSHRSSARIKAQLTLACSSTPSPMMERNKAARFSSLKCFTRANPSIFPTNL